MRVSVRRWACGGAALLTLAALQGAGAPAQASDIREPPVFSSQDGLLDLLMIAEPGVVDGFTTPGFAPIGWFYTVCRRPKSGNACPEGNGTVSSYGGVRLALLRGLCRRLI